VRGCACGCHSHTHARGLLSIIFAF
jgi:hypothetical protein